MNRKTLCYEPQTLLNQIDNQEKSNHFKKHIKNLKFSSSKDLTSAIRKTT
jgi:hypothetical protein